MQFRNVATVLLAVLLFAGSSESSPALTPDLKAVRKELISCTNPEAGVALVLQLAKLYTPDTPAPLVNSALTDALAHPLQDVRCAGAIILCAKVAADEAVPALLRALDDAESEREDVAKRAGEVDTKQLGDAFAKIAKLKEDMERAVDFRFAVLMGLASHADDRCVKAVADRLPLFVFSDLYPNFVDYLMNCGTQQSIGGVIDAFESVDTMMKERAKGRKEHTSAKIPRKLKGYPGTAAEWRALSKQRKKDKVERYDNETAALEEMAKSFGYHVRDLASKRGLNDAPKEPKASAWRTWWKRHRKEFPVMLNQKDDALLK